MFSKVLAFELMVDPIKGSYSHKHLGSHVVILG
jgi:hypothetical protein